jgi:adenylate cyclase
MSTDKSVNQSPSADAIKGKAVIMFADFIDLSKITDENEEEALRLTHDGRDFIMKECELHGGNIIMLLGDGLLMCFPSATDAVLCAIVIQQELGKRVKAGKESYQSRRIGIHLGDAFFNDGDIYGDSVNIAARLLKYAEPGGICISQAVCDEVRSKISAEIVSLGPKQLKNIEHVVNVYRVSCD